MDLVSMVGAWLTSVITDGKGQEMKLKVGIFHLVVAPYKTACLKMVGGGGSLSVEQSLITDKRFFPPFKRRIHGHRFFTLILDIDLKMILHVLAHTWKIMYHGDTKSL